MTRPNWFVACVIAAGPWLEETRRSAPERVRVFGPGDLHATVAFLGAVEADAAQRAFAVAEAQAARFATLSASLGAVVPMGPPDRFSALSAELSRGSDAVASMIAGLRLPIAAAAGVPSDPRPPRPHVTIARLHRTASAAEREVARSWAAGLELGAPDVAIETLALYTHAEDRSQRLFEIVARARLGSLGR